MIKDYLLVVKDYSIVLILFLLLIFLVVAGEMDSKEERGIISRTATTDTFDNNDGTLTKTIYFGAVNYNYNGEYIPFEDYLNVSEDNGRLKLSTLDNKICYIELEYEKTNPLSISSNKINISKGRGNYYFTTDSGTEVNSMSYKLNCSDFDLNFLDDNLYLEDIKIDFGMAKTTQNITTTYDDENKKLIFSIGENKTGNLRMVDPIVEYNFTLESNIIAIAENTDTNAATSCPAYPQPFPNNSCLDTIVTSSSNLDSSDNLRFYNYDSGGSSPVLFRANLSELVKSDITIINWTFEGRTGGSGRYASVGHWNFTDSNYSKCGASFDYNDGTDVIRNCNTTDINNFVNDSNFAFMLASLDVQQGFFDEVNIDYVKLEVTYENPTIDLDVITPSDFNGRNVTQNAFFNVTVNVTCRNADCGEINVSLDPLELQETNNLSEYVEILVKTSDNIHTNKPKKDWTALDYREERAGNGKQGYVVAMKPAGWNWGGLERDPKRFAILRILKSEWNESWLEPEYDYDNPEYRVNLTECKNFVNEDFACGGIKDTKLLATCSSNWNLTCENDYNNSINYPILTERKYVLPLESFLTTKEIDDLKNISYNQEVNWSIEKELFNVSNKVLVNDWENRPTDMKLHGSSGNFTICTSGCNYTGLFAFEAGEDSDLTGTGPAIATITEGFVDTVPASITFDGWTTTAADNIQIKVVPTARHNGKWDVSKYLLNITDTSLSQGIYEIESYFTIDGVQMEYSSTDTSVNILEFRPGAYQVGSEIVNVSNMIIRETTVTSGVGIFIYDFDNGDVDIFNNIVIGYGTATAGSIYGYSAANGNVTFYSNTVVQGRGVGIRCAVAGTGCIAKNNLVDSASTCYFGTYHVDSDYNSCNSTDTTGQGSNNFINQVYSFVDASNLDYHLASDEPTINNGTDLSSDTYLSFNTDIDGEARTGTWDLGADEYVEPEPTPPNVTINNPLNVTYNVSSVTFNVTAVDNTAMSGCSYSLNGGLANYTMSASGSEYTHTNSSIPYGSYQVVYYCNDSLGNLNNTETVDFTIAIKVGLVSTIIGTIPFYTNQSNPRNITLNKDQSQLVTFWVNATGNTGVAHTFFTYANRTADMTIGNKSSTWSVEISEAPPDTCTAPGSGNWEITCSDNCVWSTNQNIPGNISTIGSGILTLNSNFSFTSSNQYIFLSSGCELNIQGGEIS